MELKWQEGRGRGSYASHDFDKDEVVLAELPLYWHVRQKIPIEQESLALCVRCGVDLSTSETPVDDYQCARCGIKICPGCQSRWHQGSECVLLSALRAAVRDYHQTPPDYRNPEWDSEFGDDPNQRRMDDLFMILELCALLIDGTTSNNNTSREILKKVEALHGEELDWNPESLGNCWRAWRLIRDMLKPYPEASALCQQVDSERLVLLVIKISINAFSLGLNTTQGPDGFSGRVVYSRISLINHDCAPNCGYCRPSCRDDQVWWEKPGSIYARDFISRDSEISISYLASVNEREYEDRQRCLWRTWHFRCQCARCQSDALCL